MKNFIFIIILINQLLYATIPLSQKFMNPWATDINRGTFLIILPDESLESFLTNENFGGDFILFKKTQGYNVDIRTMEGIGGSAQSLRSFLQYYKEEIDPMLEYVLLIGDVDVSDQFEIPSLYIQSYNEAELDVTDYKYTYFDESDAYNPEFFLGRWSIRSPQDLIKIKTRSIQHVKLDSISDYSYLSQAMLVAGNFKTDEGENIPPYMWPVTPVWTSRWLEEELYDFGYDEVDTAFFYMGHELENNPIIWNEWNEGVGLINYRGWGDANGWHRPHFHYQQIDDELNNGWKQPIVFSFVCNTGDFGNGDNGKCFGERLITSGSGENPVGAVAVVGPSDLDTDTRFNNVICGAVWDNLLEGRVSELAPMLHTGKQALIKEFGDLEAYNGMTFASFYHHVYGILGDPSLPIWTGHPKEIILDLDTGDNLSSSYISTIVKDENNSPLKDVVGAIIYNEELIAKAISNNDGHLDIDFENIPDNSNIELYLNKSDYFQKKIDLIFVSDDESEMIVNDYINPQPDSNYQYIAIDSYSNHDNKPIYNWIERNDTTIASSYNSINLGLSDDEVSKPQALGFNFQYYGTSFDSITVCSNGWASFLPCLNGDNMEPGCQTIAHFFNNSITFPIGPYGMLAPFYDDLDDNGATVPLDVYFWTNNEDSAIVQWDNVVNGETDGEDGDCIADSLGCDWETFQLIIKSDDSPDNDGEIIFQYKHIYDVDDHGSTIGIESPDKNMGVEYLFNYNYSDGGFELKDSLAIKFVSSGLQEVLGNNKTPKEFSLLKAYPNPFNPIINISFVNQDYGQVNLDIYDLNGRRVKNLVSGFYNKGVYHLSWNAEEFVSGIYFISLNNNTIKTTKKITLIK